ncbi:MAG: septal ring lytic transglycosylase RlpA family protein, partial [Candidatus Electrothrix sp. EH2]|nr:septal ring lytic transglycosylase RlpA family protein [Candidatus Electrothrix sp. EH2]
MNNVFSNFYQRKQRLPINSNHNSKRRKRTDRIINISWRKSVFRTSCLLFCLLFVNACTSKTPVLEEPDISDPELEALEKKAEISSVEKEVEQKKEKQTKQVKKKGKQKHPEKEKKREKQRREKKKTDKKRKKIPGTQRPYVIEGQTYYPIPSAQGYEETGLASWYGDPFHGRKTANGETYDMYGVTAAHKTLPMNTMLLVKNLRNGKTATVRINDRGPFVDGRIIDLS